MRLLPIPALLLLSTLSAQEPTPPKVATTTVQDPAKPQAPKKLDEARYDHFGTGITEGQGAIDLTTVLRKPEAFVNGTFRLQGPITAVCQTKGCWMHLGSQQPPVMVKFKDYGFFMPKDASGRTAIVEGTLSMKQETVEETKHYLEDAGKTEEAAKVTEGRKLFHFMANGVAIEKKAK